MKNHRKPWTLAEETAFATFMIESIRNGNSVKQSLSNAAVHFGRKSCYDRWNRYGLMDLYEKEIEEAKRIAREIITPR